MTAIVPSVPKASVFGETTTDLSELKLSDVIRTIPRACFEKSWRKAGRSCLITLTAVTLGYGAIALAPWFLLPVAWFFTGTALTGLFVIGHDCGHRSFVKQRWVNNWLGHLTMTPLIYPFHSWRLLHDHHHVHTNKLQVDNAWQPWTPEMLETASWPLQLLYRAFRGPLWWLASIAHWAVLHFHPGHFARRDRQAVTRSIVLVGLFALLFFPTLYVTVGLWGIVKFWLMPWLGYHFWMSTFTLVHHTLPDIPFRPAHQWSAVPAQLGGTVHCTYPRWVEVLCHDINVHVPHHLSVAIPAYHLRQAHASLVSQWGEHIHVRRFSWGLMAEIIGRCHLYDADRNYARF